jgi:hypothetical protein
MGRVTGLGKYGNGLIHRRWLCGGSQPGRPHTNLVDLDTFNRCQGLTSPANTGTAMHSVNPQCELPHFSSPYSFDDRRVGEIRAPGEGDHSVEEFQELRELREGMAVALS